MIGHIQGEVLFSDGHETIIRTASGVGYQIFCSTVLAEGNQASLFISHIVKENAEDLYGFSSLRNKKLFEMLVTVKGVGPKSAFNLIGALGESAIIEAICFENKKMLQKAPGVGAKAAAQIILDLSNKIQKVKMYSDKYVKNAERISAPAPIHTQEEFQTEIKYVEPEVTNEHLILTDALMACKELGFNEDIIMPIAQKILGENAVKKPEQLVHLVLKEM